MCYMLRQARTRSLCQVVMASFCCVSWKPWLMKHWLILVDGLEMRQILYIGRLEYFYTFVCPTCETYVDVGRRRGSEKFLC